MIQEKQTKTSLVDPQKWIDTLPKKKSKSLISNSLSVIFCFFGLVSFFLLENDSSIIKYKKENLFTINNRQFVYYKTFENKDLIKKIKIDQLKKVNDLINKKEILKIYSKRFEISKETYDKSNDQVFKKTTSYANKKFQNWTFMQLIKAVLGLPPTVVK